MRLRTLLTAAAFLCVSFVARADNYTFTLNGGVTGVGSGTGVITATPVGSNGAFLVNGITGTSVNGLIPVGGYTFTDNAGVTQTNDNLFYPDGVTNFDNSGLAFYAQDASGTYDVALYSIGSNYYATITETNTTVPFSATAPVSFTLATAETPEPSSLALLGTGALGLFGAMRRRLL